MFLNFFFKFLHIALLELLFLFLQLFLKILFLCSNSRILGVIILYTCIFRVVGLDPTPYTLQLLLIECTLFVHNKLSTLFLLFNLPFQFGHPLSPLFVSLFCLSSLTSRSFTLFFSTFTLFFSAFRLLVSTFSLLFSSPSLLFGTSSLLLSSLSLLFSTSSLLLNFYLKINLLLF